VAYAAVKTILHYLKGVGVCVGDGVWGGREWVDRAEGGEEGAGRKEGQKGSRGGGCGGDREGGGEGEANRQHVTYAAVASSLQMGGVQCIAFAGLVGSRSC